MRHALVVATLVMWSCSGGTGTGGTGGGAGGGSGGSLSVSITMPSAAAFTNGTLQVALTVTGSPTKVSLKNDGVEFATVTAPYTYAWNTTSVAEGAHLLTAHAEAGAAMADSAAVSVTVDRTAPTVVSQFPAAGEAGYWRDGIGATFSEPMVIGTGTVALTIGGNSVTLSTTSLSTDALTVGAKPVGPPPSFGAMAAATLSGVTDRAGNPATTTWMWLVQRWAKTADARSANDVLGYGPVVATSSAATFVAWSERKVSTLGVGDPAFDKVYVRRFEPGVSTLLPALSFTANNAPAFVDLAIDSQGRPIVAYNSSPVAGVELHVYRLENNAWNELGPALAGVFPDLAIDSTGNPFVAYFQDTSPTSRTLKVKKWSGTAWVAAAADQVTAWDSNQGAPSGPSLALTATDAVIAAWPELNGTVSIVKLSLANGMTGWANAAVLNVRSNGDARAPSLALAGSTPYVAFEEDDGFGPDIHVVTATGTATFSRLDRALDTDLNRHARWPAIAIPPGTATPIVAWSEENAFGLRTIEVSKWNGTGWASMGGDHVVGSVFAWQPSLALDVVNQAPLVAYHAWETGQWNLSAVRLARFNGTGVPNAFGIDARPAPTACSVLNPSGVAVGTLSQTACFNLATTTPAPAADLVPFDLVSALWSDGALKRRWIRLPSSSATLTYAATGAWGFPNGTQIIKEFSYVQNPPDLRTRLPVETRFLVKRDDAGWEGYSYQWNDTFTDAVLLDAGTTQRKFWPITSASTVDGGHVQIYPSRAECGTCHVAAAGNILGPQAGQLNRTYDYGTVTDNELRTLDHLGLFGANGPFSGGIMPGRFVSVTDTRETMDRRVRGYLAANCAQCHRPGGVRQTRNFTWEATFPETNLCDAGAPFGAEIFPGDAGASMLYVRMSARGPGGPPTSQMPPLATDVRDDFATRTVAEWINSLTTCGP